MSPSSVLPMPSKKERDVQSLGRLGDAHLDLIPQLEDCAPGLKPMEYNVVVAPAGVPEKIGKLGSIFVPDDYKESQGLAMQVGRIVAMSPLAFNYDKWPDDADRPKQGDVVWFARYAGKDFEGMDGKTYRILKDRDIGAVIG